MEKRESFDQAVRTYDDSRPSYPDEVIQWVIEQTQVSTDKTLLEIGAGTGQATLKFAERGYKIHCIEMGHNLAGLLKQKAANYPVTVDVNSFEAWEPESTFETSLIFSATAFHWIDPAVRYRKCHELLKENGNLVLLWNVAPEVEIEAVKQAYGLLWEYYPEKRAALAKKTDIKSERKLEIINSGYFTLEAYLDYKWQLKQTKERFTKGFFSQSSFLSLSSEHQQLLASRVIELFTDLEDVIDTDFYTTAYIAKKK